MSNRRYLSLIILIGAVLLSACGLEKAPFIQPVMGPAEESAATATVSPSPLPALTESAEPAVTLAPEPTLTAEPQPEPTATPLPEPAAAPLPEPTATALPALELVGKEIAVNGISFFLPEMVAADAAGSV